MRSSWEESINYNKTVPLRILEGFETKCTLLFLTIFPLTDRKLYDCEV